MMKETSVLKVIVLLLCSVSTMGSRLAFRLHSDGAYCTGGPFGVQLNKLKFICTSGDNICRPGDNVVVEGHCKC